VGIAIELRTKRWKDYLAECGKLRAARGLAMPTTYAKPNARPELPKPDGLDAPAGKPVSPRKPAPGYWTEELIEERLTHYVLACRSKGVRRRQKHYGQWRHNKPGYPSASTVGRHGDFTDWVARIEARLLVEKKAA
jgi:hypothetical protein